MNRIPLGSSPFWGSSRITNSGLPTQCDRRRQTAAHARRVLADAAVRPHRVIPTIAMTASTSALPRPSRSACTFTFAHPDQVPIERGAVDRGSHATETVSAPWALEHLDGSGRRAQQPHDERQGGRLPGAVGPQEPVHGPRSNVHRHVTDGVGTPEALLNRFHTNDIHTDDRARADGRAHPPTGGLRRPGHATSTKIPPVG